MRFYIRMLCKRYSTKSYTEALDFLKYIQKVQNNCVMSDFGADHKSFPIEDYMSVYNKLRLSDSKKRFFCYYHYDGIGGMPYIMAVDKNSNVPNKIDEMYQKYGRPSFLFDDMDQKSVQSVSLLEYNEAISFMENHSAKGYVIPEDSPIGYVQFLHFFAFGENFAQFWHALMGVKFVVTSVKQIIKRVDSWEKGPYQHCYEIEMAEYDLYQYMVHSSYRPSEDEIERRKKRIQHDFENAKALKASELVPHIKMLEDYCIIEWVECYNNHGLYRCKYQISRKDYSVRKISETPILSVKPTFMY